MGAALTHDDPFDRCPADGARFPGPVIHLKVILTTAVDPVEGCTVAANTFLEDTSDSFVQCLRLFRSDRIRRCQGVKFGAMQRFVRVDVPKPGKKRLVEQQGFELTMFAVEGSVEPLRCKASTQWFRTKLAQHNLWFGGQPDAPKFARIVEYQILQAALSERHRLQVQNQSIVLFGLNCTLFDQEIAAHPQMDQQAEIGKTQDEILGAPRHVFDFLSFDQFLERAWRGNRKRTGPTQLRVQDDSTQQLGS